MNKQVPILFLVALLVSLPGCWDKKDKGKMKDMPKQKMGMGGKKMMYGKKMAQGEKEEGTTVADAALADESLKSFFDDMEEFVAFTDGADDLNLEADRDQYAWGDAEEDPFETVYFAFDRAKPDEDQKGKIESNAARAKQLLAEARDVDPEAMLVVEGHACPSAGKIWYNKQISKERAEAVAAELEKSGIDPDCMKVVGRGTKMPVLREGSRDEQWANRRVVLHVVHA